MRTLGVVALLLPFSSGISGCSGCDGAPSEPDAGTAASATLSAWSAPELPSTSSRGDQLPEGSPVKPLTSFARALGGLAQGSRKKHVRILFMGDSHARADILSGTLRTELQRRFGQGGPGFVHLGWDRGRHDQLLLRTGGRWESQPKTPSSTLPFGDGRFGLGGVLVQGRQGPLSAIAEPRESSLDQLAGVELSWDICVRADRSDATLEIEASGQPRRVVEVSGYERDAPLSHETITTKAPHQLRLSVPKGTLSLCGAIAETTDAAGVVLDTVGIDGAAYATPLAWNEPAWREELQRRSYDLFIVEYGTNEASDRSGRPEVFAGHLRSLVGRLRRAQRSASCLVVSPTDRSDRRDKVAELHPAYREAAADLGCYFWDLYQFMGGAGSMDVWRSMEPPQAAEDGIHLNPRGYEIAGRELTRVLLSEAGLNR